MSALRIVPVVDGIESGCLCVNGREIFTADSRGIRQYFISSGDKSGSIPTVDEIGIIKIAGKCSLMNSLGKSLFVLTADESFFFVDTATKSAVKLASNVIAFALQQGKPETYPSVATANRKGVSVWEHDGTKYEKKKFEISIENIKILVWVADWIVGASRTDYFTISSSTQIVEDLFPVHQVPSITVLPQSSQLLIIGQEGLGIFININESSPSPAMRSTVSLSPNSEIRVVSNYLVSSSFEGVLEIFSLSPETPKKVQTINLPSSAIFANGSLADTGLPAIAGSVMYLLIPVPFETQMNKLMDLGKFDEAFELIQFHQTDSEFLAKYHLRVAWYMFKSMQFGIAFQHFHLCPKLNVSDWKEILQFWENEKSEFLTEQANHAFGFFLDIERKAQRVPLELLPQVEKCLLKYLSDTELLALIANETLSIPMTELPALLAKGPLAAVYEQNGQIDLAIATLSGELNCVDQQVALLNRNYAKIEIDVLERELSILIGEKKFERNIFFLISKTRNPMMFVDKLTGDTLEIIEMLSESNEDAFLKLLELSDDKKIEMLIEKTTKFHSDKVLSQLKGWPRIICLGKLGRHRDALLEIEFAGFNKYVKLMSVADDSLVLLYCSILFESGRSQDAFKLMFDVSPKFLSVIPSDEPVSTEMCEVLKKMNAKLLCANSQATVEANLASWQFLKTHAEWAHSRQTNPALIESESICPVCNLPIGCTSVAVMPTGSVMHSICFGSKSI